MANCGLTLSLFESLSEVNIPCQGFPVLSDPEGEGQDEGI